MRIGICDAIAAEREQIKKYCQKFGYDHISLYPSGTALLNSTELPRLNLLFLDIELGNISGIEIKKKLEQTSPCTFIVFISFHRERMPDAFGYNVISFLTKPLKESSIQQCIKRAACLSMDFYPVTVNEHTHIPCKDILYFHAEQKYTVIYTTDGKTFITRRSLKDWTIELEKVGFCAISRGTIINLKHYIKTNKEQVLLHNDILLPISRRYRQLLGEKFNNYILHMMRLE